MPDQRQTQTRRGWTCPGGWKHHIAALAAAVTIGGAGLTSTAHGQTAPLEWEDVPVNVDSGLVEARPGERGEQQVVFSEVIEVERAEWVRLVFGDVELAGSIRDGDHARLRITSLKDGAEQHLDARSLTQWNNTSAYFNGSAVRVEVLAAPDTGASRLEVDRVQAGEPGGETIATICGDSDDRELAEGAPDARIRPVGCTGFLVGERCFLTAGHCTTGFFGGFDPNRMEVIEFNPPLSDPDGSINFAHPDDQYPVHTESIQFQDDGCGEDWAYFGTFDNSNTGLTPLEAQGEAYTLASAAPSPQGNIRIRGYGTTTSTELPNEWSQVQTEHTGPYVEQSGTLLQYKADTTGGNSGSAVFHVETGEVIGVHNCTGCGPDWPDQQGNRGTGIEISGLQQALAFPQGICDESCPGEGGCFEANNTVGCDNFVCCQAVCAEDPFCCDTEWDATCAQQAETLCAECGAIGSGECLQANGTPGCDDATCCEAVCAEDPYCCDTEWDATCADIAVDIEACLDLPDGCPGDGDCFSNNGTPGCEDPVCCATICEADPFCCNTSWDGICASAAADHPDCLETGPCPGDGSCFEPNGTPGCDDESCCETICDQDPFCCDTEWDEVCAEDAMEQCAGCGDSDAGSCFESNGSAGCDDSECCKAVCAEDPFCCETKWDSACVEAAANECGIDGDLTGDGTVGGADLGILLSEWGPCDDCDDCPADLTGDCEVGGADLGSLLSNWTQ